MAGLFGDITDAVGITQWGAQEDALNRATAYFNGIQLPEQRALELDRLVSVGELTPELAKTILQESTAFKDIRTDPKLKDVQYEALMGLQERAKEGLTAEDRYQMAKIKSEEDATARGQREAITQQAAMQGRGGSGLEMLSKMQNQQDSATRQAMRDAQQAALSQKQKMEALLASGQMGSQMQQADYGQQAELAKAKDYMNQFNIANQMKTEGMNVNAMNAAKEANLAQRQKEAAANVALRNQEILYGANQAQQQFSNQVALAGGKAGAQQNLANMYGQQGQANLGMGAGIAAAVAASDVRVKENIHEAPMDIDKFLNDITGYKYNYKDQNRYGQGERLGVMAQDMEKSPMGKESVVPMEDGVKGIDSTKALHAVLASVGRLNERLKKVEE